MTKPLRTLPPVLAPALALALLIGLGMAPGANLVEQVYSPWYTQPGGMLLLMTESYRNNASLSGNSWGPSSSPVGYDDDTRQVDVGVRDADPDPGTDFPPVFCPTPLPGKHAKRCDAYPVILTVDVVEGSTIFIGTDGQKKSCPVPYEDYIPRCAKRPGNNGLVACATPP